MFTTNLICGIVGKLTNVFSPGTYFNTTAPQIPDYILIDDVAGGTDPIPIINAQDGNIYNGQTYLCEQALAVSPGTRIFSACYNDGRVRLFALQI